VNENRDHAARNFAILAHAGQQYGAKPYVTHLDDVADLIDEVAELHERESLLAVAYLHDVLEDTAATREQIDELFGPVVAEAVADITDPPGADRAERKQLLHWRLHETDVKAPSGRAALLVKTADRLANIRACIVDGKEDLLKMYVGEHWAFRVAVHRSGLCDAWWAEMDALYHARR
jgi:(p)ppGpp synthase/HD superfamily hydrolase